MTVCGLWILLIALMKFQNGVAGQTVFCGDMGDQREHGFLQFFDGSAVNAKFGGQSTAVDGVFIAVKKFPNAAFNDAAAVSNVRNFDHRAFQEISNAVDQRIVVDDICDFRGRNRQLTGHRDFFRFFQIRSPGKANDGIDRVVFSPTIDHSPQLDLIADRMVYLVDKDRKGGQFSNQVAQLIGLAVLFVVTLLKQADLPVFFLNAVKDNFLRVGHGNQSKQLG